ncbi:hypothetical protein DEA8626_01674 [Defluviimonas aquaemixtae]|uniref:Uncharacterized protein n=1 Tax=Albidovulum aquaemixtae TaxID=1542388 RepID=A0A2R8B6F8_9RHOB|nr:tetratricopeptide repeat-containing protein [Defluviimonas aquaemixtae]SPH18142.1 hypothetical protein DEA8626_01674 [Defluviimonas aquaemixtae]
MTTNMSVPHIWGSERANAEMRIAREAGWRRADLIWERLMEAANSEWASGRAGRARHLFLVADIHARLTFPVHDPRRATAPGARAALALAAGRSCGARRLQRRALSLFGCAEAFIEGMEIRPRARSSLFHLRMEARHLDTYHRNLRLRLTRMAEEFRETLEALDRPGAAAHRGYSRWRGEKPPVFDDTRKMLAACLLIPDGPFR